MTLIEVRQLVRHYPVRAGLLNRRVGAVRAVDGVSFSIEKGQTLGIVGESGCGKTTVARQMLGIERPPKASVFFEGLDVAVLRGSDLKAYRRRVQAVLQDPYSSLNPRLRVRTIIAEPMDAHGLHTGDGRNKRVGELLSVVGLNPAMGDLYPHQFSGGQRQRIAIARALAVSPDLIVLDEPVSALDVSIRGQILNLLKDLQDDLDVSYLLIAHDLPSVAFMSDVVAVMYLGKIMEMARSRDLVANALHPYTQALLAAALPPDVVAARKAIPIQGEVPSPISPPSGCVFHTRCPAVMPQCSTVVPDWVEVCPGHFAACHLHASSESTGATAGPLPQCTT